MNDTDPFETGAELVSLLPEELRAEGLEDAQKIGHGGFGVVYLCAQPSLDRAVAVKVLINEVSAENRERFIREQRVMGRLTGIPNIVSALQIGVTDSGKPFIVMPYFSRGSLDTRIRRDGQLHEKDVLRLGVKLAGALDTAHARGVVHRDVKPANVLLTDYDEPALADFGIAHVSGGFETATGSITGSPAFTAPEILRGGPAGPSSDIYGLGATLFCALTGHAAPERRSGEKVIAQFIRITTEGTPDLKDHGVADDVAAVLQQAMSGRPEDRQLSVAVFGEQLREIDRLRRLRGDSAAYLQGFKVEQNPFLHSQVSFNPPLDRSGNLPSELSSFVGRRNQIVEAKRLLATSRLLTLVGIGGVGKTRLAVRVATDLHRDFADGAWLVELDEVRTSTRLIDVVATTFGVRDQTDRSLREIVLDFLCSGELLLVLDNCEQAAGVVAAFASALLRRNPKLRILATSREPLSTTGEATLRVPPLTVPDPDYEPALRGLPRYDAVSLFADRGSRYYGHIHIHANRQQQVCRDADLSEAGRVAAADRTGCGTNERDVA